MSRTPPHPDAVASTSSTPARPEWMARTVVQGGSPWSRRFAPPHNGGRSSAVLMLFGPGESGGEDVVLTQRSDGLRQHAGQVSFPGGSTDPGDRDAAATALREAAEEIGLRAADVDVVGAMEPLFLSVTDFVVTPVLAWSPRPAAVRVVDPAEVARVVRVPVSELVDPANRFTVHHPSGYVGPGFEASGLFVWGFTAGVLSELLDLAGLSAPWDRRVRRSFDAGTGAGGNVAVDGDAR